MEKGRGWYIGIKATSAALLQLSSLNTVGLSTICNLNYSMVIKGKQVLLQSTEKRLRVAKVTVKCPRCFETHFFYTDKNFTFRKFFYTVMLYKSGAGNKRNDKDIYT